MAADFPTSLAAIQRVLPGDFMDAPGTEIDLLHNQICDELEALQAKVGIDGSAVATSIDKRLTDVSADVITAQATADDATDIGDAAVAAAQRNYGLWMGGPSKNPGQLINACTSATGFAFTGASGVTGGVDATFPSPEGGNSAWLNVPLASGNGYGRITITQNVTFAATDSIAFRVYVESPGIHYIQCALLQSSSGAELKRSVSADGLYEAAGAGWYNVVWKLSDFTVTGTPNYSNPITSIQLQFGLSSSGPGQGRVAVSNVRRNAASGSFVIYTADRNYSEQYDVSRYFSAAGVPLNIYTDASKLDQSGYMTTAQALALFNDPTGLFEIASYPDYLPTLQHTDTGIALAQAVGGAGNLTLNGTLASGGVASWSGARKVVLSTLGNNRLVQFTITGSLAGQAKSEVMTGTWVSGSLCESVQYYDSVTQIAVSASCSGNVSVGTSYTVAEHVAAITGNSAALIAKGLGGAHLHVAYASGLISQPLFTALQQAGVQTGRPNAHTQAIPRNMLVHDASFNPWLLSAVNLFQSVATLKSIIDDVVARGGVLVFYFHRALAANDGSNPSFADLGEIIAYSRQYEREGKLRHLKLSQLWGLHTGYPKINAVP